jgi:hypothetical protein
MSREEAETQFPYLPSQLPSKESVLKKTSWFLDLYIIY